MPRRPTCGDYNADGRVDGLDFLTWANHYGAGTVVQKPAALVLLVGCVAALANRR